jgi:hypothetical protein
MDGIRRTAFIASGFQSAIRHPPSAMIGDLRRFILLSVLFLTVFPAPAEPFNPKPKDGDLVLPMPGGGGMVFRPVFIDAGDSPFACRTYTIGDRTGGFKEYPTSVILGGAFLANKPAGGRDWMFYLGKYEVTESQYAAVMGGGAPALPDQPVVSLSWFDAQEFIRRYNLWLLTNAPNQVPVSGDLPGYVRLPTEAEWEFAARGGAAVGPDVFDRKRPYADDLARYEWFSGPTSSHDKIKKAGLLQANPLGLHDMLGNVSEMTESLYRLEYYQGRTGGYVARGGSFRTPEKNLRSSMRTEQPFFSARRAAVTQDEMGFRLVLTAPVFTGRAAINEMEAGWEEYRKTRPTVTSPKASVTPTSQQAAEQIAQTMQTLNRLEATLQQAAGVPPDAINQMGLLRASFGNVESIVLKGESDSAMAWSRIGSYTAWLMWYWMAKLPTADRLIEMAKAQGAAEAELQALNQRRDELAGNVAGATRQYAQAFEELVKLSPDTVQKGFGDYERRLIEAGAAEQIKVNRLTAKQCEEYRLNRRLDMDKWKKELSEALATPGAR